MRNLVLMATIAIMLFSGCAEIKTLTLQPSGIKYTKTKKKDLVTVSSFDKRFTIKDALHIVSKEVLDMNRSYFVLTSSGTNNLEGFPINSYKDLDRYINLHNTNPKFTTNGYNYGIGKTKTIRSGRGRIRLFVMPVGDEYKNSFISVWNAKKTFEDTK